MLKEKFQGTPTRQRRGDWLTHSTFSNGSGSATKTDQSGSNFPLPQVEGTGLLTSDLLLHLLRWIQPVLQDKR